jgi:hypothetical protein
MSGGTIEEATAGDATPISAIGVAPPASAQEVVSHGTQQNNIDPYAYINFLAVANITWSTSQLAGTILYSTPLHPSRINWLIAFYANLYNLWGGGFEYKMKVAGTGFHAGALAIARIPPNIDPYSLNTVEDLTAFEYEVFDPKQLEMFTRVLVDQRNIMYHYRNLDLKDPNTFGGYFVIFVLMPLNTSSTGVNQINVQIFTRAAQDFTFSQIRPISLNAISETPSIKAQALFPLGRWNEPLLDGIIDQFVIKAGSGYQLMKTWYGSKKASGADNTYPYEPFQSIVQIFNPNTPQNATNTKKAYRFGATDKDQPGLVSRPVSFGADDVPVTNPPITFMETGISWCQLSGFNDGDSRIQGASYFSMLKNAGITYDQTKSTYPGVNTTLDATGVMISVSQLNEVNYVQFNDDRPATMNSPAIPESYFVFRSIIQYINFSGPNPTDLNTKFNCDTVQTTQMIRAIELGSLNLSVQEALILILRDVATLLPVRYLKLYYDGYITSAVTLTELIYNAKNYTLVPLYVTAASDPLPSSPSVLQNEMICQMRDQTLGTPTVSDTQFHKACTEKIRIDNLTFTPGKVQYK